MVATARLRYLGTSAQKARLVVDLIRGMDVGQAVATLRYTRKAVAGEIGRLLDSAVANAHQKSPEVDVDRLFVKAAYVDGGPSLKRIRPAPMGRAFRVLKRMCHVTIGLGERRAAGGGKATARRRAAAATGRGPGAAPKKAHPRAARKKGSRTQG
ncbi:MAG: 50S ribosomal protein L22 [Acidobacteria bacterium]|nr:50S ribosomal protein L22 [Acidobacteriota bacterium]